MGLLERITNWGPVKLYATASNRHLSPVYKSANKFSVSEQKKISLNRLLPRW